MVDSEAPNRRTGILGWFRWLIHPKEARSRAEKPVPAKTNIDAQPEEKSLLELRREADLQWWAESRPLRNEWLDLACDPYASPDELQDIVNAYRENAEIVDRLAYRTLGVLVDDQPSGWNQRFQRSVCANPNLPFELFIQKLEINEHTVAGLLHNPLCPLLLLEHPNLIEVLGYHRLIDFGCCALRHENIPRPLLTALTSIPERWLALEAYTHVGNIDTLSPAEHPGTLDLAWLDQQVLERVREAEFPIRCLLYELAWHGLIRGKVARELENPWQDTDFQVRLQEVMRANSIEQCVQEAKSATHHGRKAQDDWIIRWKETMRSHVTVWHQAAVFHPEIPFWAVCEIKRHAGSYLNWPALQHQEVPLAFIAECREEAFQTGVSLYSETFSPAWPGLFYLTVQNAPQERLGSLFEIFNTGPESARHLQNQRFLVRLAVAFRADDTDPDQRQLRGLLWDDPNCYVRAAARKHLVWPGPQA